MPNLVYINPGTAFVWTVGGALDIDMGALAADGVRIAERVDLTASAHSQWFEWRLHVDGFDTAPVVGETVDLYVSTSDGTNEDGNVGTADAAGATTDLPNLKYLGSAVVQTITAGDDLNVSGLVQITSRYFSPVVHNNTADALLGTADAHSITFTPVPEEIQ